MAIYFKLGLIGKAELALSATILFLGCITLLFPSSAAGAVKLSNVSLGGNVVWKASKGPYYVSGRVTVPSGSSLVIEKGTEVVLTGGTLLVRGSLDVMGVEDMPVRMRLDAGSNGMAFEGGRGYMGHAHVTGGRQAIDAYSKSEIVISQSVFEPEKYSGAYVYLRDGSTGTFEGNKFVAGDGFGYAVQAYDSLGYFSNNDFSTIASADSDHEYQGVGIGLYATESSVPGDVGRKSIYELSGNKFARMKHGIEAFRNVFVTIDGNEFKENSNSGLILHSEAEAMVLRNEFSDNRIGIESYNSSTTISDNAFEANKESSLAAYGGNVDATGNWWNSSSGPYHAIINAPGTGETVDSEPWLKLYPWIFKKPKRIVCCSSVYFIPGLQASRLYRKSFGIENQLWEPNRNGDVQKLFFKKEGGPVQTSIYAKGIIDRTNVTGGVYEKDIYKGFSEYIDGLVRERQISGWKSFAYDWRYSPLEIVEMGKAAMVSDIKSLAKKSKTGKVAVVAHSYGGLVFREFQSMLKREGLDGLIDKVILVGVPERGSPKAVMSALHGEGQEIGMGLILNKKTARQFGLGIPATFSLMPDSTEMEALSVPLVRTPTQSVTTSSELESFLLRNGSYSTVPASASHEDIDLPAKAEERLMAFYRKGNPPPIQHDTGTASTSWRVSSIIGTGIPTIAGIRYEDSCQGLLFRIKAFLSRNKNAACPLSRRPVIATRGDGAVLTGDIDAKSGKKFVFDIARYNSVHERNISHADMLSYGPILMAVHSILKDVPDKDVAGGFISEHDPELVQEDPGTPLQWITVSGDVYVSNGKRFVLGKDGMPATTTLPGNIQSEFKVGDAIVLKNTIPNMQYLDFGDVKHFISPIEPLSIEVQSRDLQPTSIEVSYTFPSSSVRYTYPPVILTQDSVVHVTSVASSSSPGPVTASSSSVPVIGIDVEGDGTVDETVPPDQIEMGNGSGTTTVPIPEKEEMPSFEEAVAHLKLNLASSSVSEPYKSRYYRKATALERKLVGGASTSAGTNAAKAKAREYLQTNVRSLAAIFSELTVMRTGKYLGTMQAADATYLYLQFYDVLKAALAEL